MRRVLFGLALAAILACWARGDSTAATRFSFAVITDLHVGTGIEDFGTPGYDDKLDRIPEEAGWAKRDREAVKKINALKDRVKFVFVTGDITDSAERSEFAAAKLILDELQVPYFPIPGNHDLWPFVGSNRDLNPGRHDDEASGPIGDLYFEQTFAETFARAETLFPDLSRAPRPMGNPESKRPSFFQNFVFSHEGFGFVALDWNNRKPPTVLWKGAWANSQLFDFAGGTFRWLQGLINSGWAAKQKKIFMFQHHPYRSLVPDWSFTFGKGEKKKMRGLLSQARFWGVFAGHLHYSKRSPAFDEESPRLSPEPPGFGLALGELRDAAGSTAPDVPNVGGEKAVGGEDPRFQQVVTAAAATSAQVTVVDVLEDGSVLVGQY